MCLFITYLCFIRMFVALRVGGVHLFVRPFVCLALKCVHNKRNFVQKLSNLEL